ncbi:MAG: FtsX-like permease family protein, partial [Bacteroidota bacterium]
LLVLSVFNGLEDLVKSLFRSFDPDIKIALKKGKSFVRDAALVDRITATPGVAKVVEVVEDNAMLRYQDYQLVAKVKGVSDNFLQQSPLAPFLLQGNFQLKSHQAPLALVGSGVCYALSVRLADPFHVLQVLYPRPARGTPLMPSQLYRRKVIRPGAVFAVEKHFDEQYVIVPLDFAAALMDMEDHRTALEITVASGFSVKTVQQELCQVVPERFSILNSDEQQPALMQAIHIERLFVLLTFSLILLVASLNIFFVLSMLLLDKRRDMAVLYTLGATPRDVQRIFLIEGFLIALCGTALGMVAAWGLSWLQERFGLVSMGTSTSLVEAYPIRRQASDFVYTAISVVAMTLVAAYRPARLAAQTMVARNL